jgi:hypothetical protein
MSEEKEEKQPQEMSSKSSLTSDESLMKIRSDPSNTMVTRLIAGAILNTRYKPKKMPPPPPPEKRNLS